MRVSAIPNIQIAKNTQKTLNDYDNRSFSLQDKAPVVNVFAKKNVSDDVSFSSAARAKALTSVNEFEVHCMYCKGLMINPEKLEELKLSGVLTGCTKEVLSVIRQYSKRLLDVPKSAFDLLSKLSKHQPDDNLQELLLSVQHRFSKDLIKKQKTVVSEVYKMGKNLPPENKKTLDMLMQISKYQLLSENGKASFSRQTFLNRLTNFVLEGIEDKNLVQRMTIKAEELPNSSNSLAAFIIKNKNLSSEDIAYSILSPSAKSVEHLTARCNDPIETSKIGNYLLAHAGENNNFKDLTLKERIARKPETIKNSRIQLRELRKLANQGRLRPEDIETTRKTLVELSDGLIDVNLSKMKTDAYQKRIKAEIERKKELGQKIKLIWNQFSSNLSFKPIILTGKDLQILKTNTPYKKVIVTPKMCYIEK